jgi:hypothetical protein
VSPGSPVVADVASTSAAVSSAVPVSARRDARLQTSSRLSEGSQSLVGGVDSSSVVAPSAPSRKRMRSGGSAVAAFTESSATVPSQPSASVRSRTRVHTSSPSFGGRAREKEELLSRLADANAILSRAQADLDNARARYARLLTDLADFIE